MKKNDAELLKNFVRDQEKLNQLDKLANKLNYFEILSVSDMEIRHSNMLAWLIQPKANHGLSDSIFICLFKYILENYETNISLDLADKIFLETEEIRVFREWNHIDIMVISHKYKFFIAFENKIYSQEHGNQLETYRKWLEKNCPEYKSIYLYLTLFGNEAVGDKKWQPISYLNIIKIIDVRMISWTRFGRI